MYGITALNVHWGLGCQARVDHVGLDLAIDFERQQISGTATLDITRAANAWEIVLDRDGYEVLSVTDGRGLALEHRFGEGSAALGSPRRHQSPRTHP